MGKQKGGNCGCSSGGLNTSGGLMSGGSGYSFGASSSPMLLGPQSGYGAIDPYEVGITSGATRALAYPPLTKFIGGQSSKRRSSKKSKSKSNSKSKSRKTRGAKSKKSKSKSSKSKSKSSKSKSTRRSRGNHVIKQRLQKGGELAFSDFVSSPDAASSPSVGQVASSPTYGVDLSPLGHKLSALANPIRPEIKNNCN